MDHLENRSSGYRDQPMAPFVPAVSRREALKRVACGFGHTALLGLLSSTVAGADAPLASGAKPLDPRAPHFAPKAKQVIFLFLHGGVSHIDSFDPKPMLDRMHDKPFPGEKPLQFSATGNLMRSPWKFHNYGESGLPISDLFPHIGSMADNLCVIRSMHVEQVDHGGAILQLNTGSAVFPRPSVGSWVCYGLGTENENLPGFVAMSPPTIHGAKQNFGSAFLPATYQGTPIGDANIRMASATVRDLNPAARTRDLQRLQLDFVQEFNRRQRDRSPGDLRLDARIESFELAFRMQMEAPEVLDFDGESPRTLDLYGVGSEPTDNFGRQCLLARRLVERGVRFVQCSHTYKWDQHGALKTGHEANAREVDQPIGALLRDLKNRGMLDETLVVFGTEFGRTPVSQGDGRDHNPYGFSLWLAGGGVKGGFAYGSTDEFGYFAQENPVSMFDFHATLLHLLGLDHERLTYRHAGRDFRLTDVFGRVVDELIV